jgi:hypothetical protein
MIDCIGHSPPHREAGSREQGASLGFAPTVMAASSPAFALAVLSVGALPLDVSDGSARIAKPAQAFQRFLLEFHPDAQSNRRMR